MSQNHIKDLDIARQFVKKENIMAMKLICTAFVAIEVSSFIVEDFSAIETRVLAWLADEK